MEQEVESLARVSNGYLFCRRIGEMGENTKRPDGIHRMLSMLLVKLNKLHVFCFLFFLNLKVVGKYIVVYQE